jgi:membrane protease YdiL (CAAX protease family)
VVLLFAIFIVGSVAWVVSHGADIGALTRSLNSLFGIELQSAAEVAVVIYLAILVPAIAKCSLRDLGFRMPASDDAVTALVGIVTMFVLVTVLGSVLTTVFHVKQQEMAVQVFLRMFGWQKVAFALFAVVVGPVTEEFFFRIFLFNAMRKWWSFWPAAIVSAILFGLAHAQPGGPGLLAALAVPLAVGGVVLAYVYARTGNAWTNIVTHAAFNGLSLLLITVAPQLAK